jgi:hypothetical protein
VLRPCQPAPPSPELQRRFDRGREFEGAAVADLEERVAVVMAEGETPEELEASTAEAINGVASVIIGGRLPTDRKGRRVGKPDIFRSPSSDQKVGEALR